MNTVTRNVLVLMMALVLGAPAALAEGNAHKAPVEQSPNALPLKELRTFTDVFAKIKSDYVEKVSDKELIENAIRGMLAGLDPHSAYLSPEEYKELQEGTTGEFGGLGIEVGMEDGFVKVIAPIDDTPAQRAGIKAGDLIVKLGDTPVKGMTLNEAVKRMRGPKGSPVTLTIVREGEDKPLTFTVKRAIIKIKSVKSRMLAPGFGYLRISHFQSNTGDDLRKALSKLKKENGGHLRGLVLDLRNNPGGVLSAAVEVANTFLNHGMIVYTKGRIPDSQLDFKASPPDYLNGAPMVVLVNSGSASASEIVAGALQDHKRAVIMGTKTFGKGSVQTILPMTNHGALKLTTARYYTPSGRSIQAEGIVPNIVLDRVKIASVKRPAVPEVTEADLSGHLNNDTEKKAPKKQAAPTGETGQETAKTQKEPLAETDYDLYEALNLLKGLALYGAKAGSS